MWRQGFIVFLFLISGSRSADYNYLTNGADWTGTCLTGTEQSPVNLYEFKPADGDYTVTFSYNTLNAPGTWLSHTYQVDGDWGVMNFYNRGMVHSPSAIQFHFHGPSENAINGYLYDLEMHIVHADADMNLFVIGIMFEVGDEENAFINTVINSDTMAINLHQAFNGASSLDYFFVFDGSLTTPPCSEGVQWTVWGEVQTISHSQLDYFTGKWAGDLSFANGNGNNRVVQPLYERSVFVIGDYAFTLVLSFFLASLF